MGKKKTPVFRDGSKHNVNKDDGKIKAIRTWDDIEHDSEDEFHEAREKVLLEEKDDFQTEEESEAEVYGLDMESDEEEEEEDEEEQENGSDDELLGKKRDFEEDEEIDESWGNQKRDYYDADEGEDLEEMKEEEAEALKIQKQRLEAMDEADFMDDTLPGWGKGAEKDAAADKALLEDFSKELKNISFDVSKSVEKRRAKMTVAEKLKVLQNESPELLDLLNEFKDKNEEIEGLEAVLEKVQSKNRQDEDVPKFLRFKHQLLMNYMTNVSFYFVLKASGVVDIKSHPVIDALVELRSTLEKAEKVEEELQPEIEDFFANLDAPTTNGVKNTTIDTTVTKAQIPEKKKNNNKKKKSVSKVVEQEPEFSANDLDGELEQDDVQDYQELSEKEGETNAFDVEQEFKSLKKANKKRKRSAVDDFGELDALDELDMEDKIARKRSLRDYVAKIDAKQAKMQSKYQGDLDIPYKERQTKAEKKGVAQPEDTSADLDNDDYDEQDMEMAAAAMGQDGEEDDEYYNQVVASKAAQKAAKKAEYDAERAPLIDGDLHVEEGEKRLASYKMLKNKGLTRHRKKETRNARVKNRNKYAKKLKKLSSQRAIVKPLQGAYGGEATGIKSNVVKSIRF